MTVNKTQVIDSSVDDFISGLKNEQIRVDAEVLQRLFTEITQLPALMWGPNIVGYGVYHYQTADNKTQQFLRTGFAPRKQNLTVYLMTGFSRHAGLLSQLGKHTVGKSCLYINRLTDIDLAILEQLILASWAEMNARYPR
jgi:hypothetical protein